MNAAFVAQSKMGLRKSTLLVLTSARNSATTVSTVRAPCPYGTIPAGTSTVTVNSKKYDAKLMKIQIPSNRFGFKHGERVGRQLP